MFVFHYEFIKYTSVCYYKYAIFGGQLPVQTLYSDILIRVNKKVFPLHNLPLPPKKIRLATSLAWTRATSLDKRASMHDEVDWLATVQ